MDLESGCENSSSCSELLERLKNLRRWQEEQRRELVCQSLGELTPSSLSGTDTKAGSELLSVELSHSFMSSINTQSGSGRVSEETPQLLNVSFSSTMNYSISGNEVLSPSVSENNGLQNLSIPTGSLSSMEELPLSRMSENVSKNSDGTAQEVSASDGEIGHQNASHEVLYNRDSYSTNLSLRHESDPMKKLQGLSRFVSRHSPGTGSLAVDAICESEMKNSTEDLASLSSKPKFTFLRKGEGTARFGMKHFKLKSKINKDSSNIFSEEFTKQRLSPNKKSLGTRTNPNLPKENTAIISRMPVKQLKLQKDHTRTKDLHNLENSTYGRYNVKFNQISNLEQPYTSHKNSELKITEGDKHSRREREELSAFEKLEELAEDSSFSSNASTVVQLLQRGLHSSSSTPVRSSPPPVSHFTPLYHAGTDKGVSIKLMDRIEAAAGAAGQAVPQQTQSLPILSISQILEQLQGIIKLENINEGSLSQEELKLLIESFYDSDTSLPVRSAGDFENNIKLALGHPTSTPAAPSEGVFPPRPRVHFRPEGVEVLEYEVSESDEENTLTDMASIAEDTDLVTTSDLEILTQVNMNPASNCKDIECKDGLDLVCDVDEGVTPSRESVPKKPSHISNKDNLKPLKLQFSPPRQPENSASHYIWSIFKKKGLSENKGLPREKLIEASKRSVGISAKYSEDVDNEFVSQERVEGNASSKTKNQQEVETHKTLLMAKVCELEKEMELYKKENSKLKSLREMMLSKQHQLDQEKQRFAEEMAKEKKRFQEYVDRERNTLWKEKQVVAQQSPSFTAAREQSLEIVYLKENLHDLQEEVKKKESLHQFALKKLNEKIQIQEEEIKLLKEKNNQLKRIEKENIHLKHEVDRTKLNKKPVPTIKPVVGAARRQRFNTKTATISSVNKSLDNVHISASSRDPSSRPQKKKSATIRSINKSLDKVVVGNAALAEVPLFNSWPKVRQTSSSEDIGNLNEQEHHISSPVQHMDISERLMINNMKNISNIQGKSSLEDGVVGHTASQESDDEGKDEQPHNEIENPIEYQEGKGSPTFQKNLSIECTEFCHSNGTKEIIYANGNKKEILPNGSVIISYYNGDRKEVYEDRTVYVYGTDLTSHTTFMDGREVLEFPNGQKETRFSDGSSEIVFSDNTRKAVLPDGTELCTTTDGTVVHTNPDGIKVFEFASGQREVHTPEQKRREYPDGTVKILYVDGRTETRYKKGRIRVKDKEGNVITDTHQSVQ